MTWGFVGAAAVSAVAGAVANNQKNKAAKGAANAQIASQQQAADEFNHRYDQTREDLSPYMTYGQGAVPLLSKLNSGDYSGFMNSPDYQFAMQQGIGNLDQSAASRGSLFSGGHERDLSQFNQGLASQYLGNYRNSLMQQLQSGQQAATNLGQFGMQAGQGAATAYGNQGNAQANSLNTQGDNNSQLTTGIAGLLANGWQNYASGQQAGGGASSYQAPAAASYTGLGGQPAFGNQQPAFGNNYSNFGNWGY